MLLILLILAVLTALTALAVVRTDRRTEPVGLGGASPEVHEAASALGYDRGRGIDAVESIHEGKIACTGLALGLLQFGGDLSRNGRDTLLVYLQLELGVPRAEAENLILLGRWLVDGGETTLETVAHLAMRLHTLDGPDSLERLEAVLDAVTAVEETQADPFLDETMDEVRAILSVQPGKSWDSMASSWVIAAANAWLAVGVLGLRLAGWAGAARPYARAAGRRILIGSRT